MNTIICAVDGSTNSGTALEAAALIAERSDAELLVATVKHGDPTMGRTEQLGAAVAVASTVVRRHACSANSQSWPPYPW
jgi:hypothetical protein